MSISHIGFSDESAFNKGRYRGIAFFSMEAAVEQRATPLLANLLAESGILEFKWSNLRSARERLAAYKLIDCALSLCSQQAMRVDILTWDTMDGRHTIKRRDDVQNLQRMYYHLYRNVMAMRWGQGADWSLVPDANSAMNWQELQLILSRSSSRTGQLSLGSRGARIYSLAGISASDSKLTPFIQLADLFAGIGVYSREEYGRYSLWRSKRDGQASLFGDELSLNATQLERFAVLDKVRFECRKLGIVIEAPTKSGFITASPSLPVNFWWYTPQSSLDKAPVKQTAMPL